MKKIALLTTILFLYYLPTFSQSEQVTFEGKILEGNIPTEKVRAKVFNSPQDLQGVQVTIKDNSQILDDFNTEEESNYEIFLQPDMEYTITFSKNGYIPKTVDINTYGMSIAFIQKGYELYTDITLFKEFEYTQTDSYSKLPVAKCNFHKKKKTLLWDMKYSEQAFQTFLGLLEEEQKQAEGSSAEPILASKSDEETDQMNFTEELETINFLSTRMNLLISSVAKKTDLAHKKE